MASPWTVEPLWKGERVFIIAGGSSAIETLKNRNTRLPDRIIAIKDAAFLQPRADLFFYAEPDFHKTRKACWDYFEGAIRAKRAIHDDVPAGVWQIRRQHKSNREVNGLAENPALLGGHCSGGSAINLAYHLGAREMILIGFDLSGAHWNVTEHPYPYPHAFQHERHRRSIEAMAAPLKRAGVKVFNTSSTSSLRSFPHASLAEILAV